MLTTCAPGLDAFDPLSLTHYDKRLSAELGLDLYLQRDDLMPVPFGGNKWIKLSGIVGRGRTSTVYISNGGVDSNHCRAMAVWAGLNERECHFVLHGQGGDECSPSVRMLERLGATTEIVAADQIASRIQVNVDRVKSSGKDAAVVPGGGHSREGALAFSAHASKVLAALNPEVIVFASGTGGTQAGIIHALHQLGMSNVRAIGISVARDSDRGEAAIRELLKSVSLERSPIDFRDSYREGGYGYASEAILHAVNFASKRGLLLDTTYTGKAFHALLGLVESGEIAPATKVLFWQTGGGYLATQDNIRKPLA